MDIKRLLLVFMVSCIGIMGTFAQDGRRPKMSEEEFRQKQEAFITDRADLTQDEAAKFFPIYFELQDKKKALNDRAWSQIKRGKKEKMTEAEYDAIITNIFNARIASDKLEKAYYYRFKAVLSCEKIFKVQGAEMRFHRELIKDFARKP